jgi:hypothetical protein
LGIGVSNVFAIVLLGVEPPSLPALQLDLDHPPAKSQPAPERRQRHHDAVWVGVNGGSVARVIVVPQNAHTLVLKEHVVGVGV